MYLGLLESTDIVCAISAHHASPPGILESQHKRFFLVWRHPRENLFQSNESSHEQTCVVIKKERAQATKKRRKRLNIFFLFTTPRKTPSLDMSRGRA